MNHKLKKILTNVRVIILLVFLVLSVAAINPRPGIEGVMIKNVITNSSATEAGILQVPPTTKPVDRERILAINNRPINDERNYYDTVSKFAPNESIQIKTNKGLYRFKTSEAFDIVELNETVTKVVEEIVFFN